MSVPKKPASPASPSPSDDGLPPAPAFTRKPGGSYPPEVREYALLLIVRARPPRKLVPKERCPESCAQDRVERTRYDGAAMFGDAGEDHCRGTDV